MPDSIVYVYWWATIAGLLLVTLIVAIVLQLILREARRIDVYAAQIWTTGKLIANNTILTILLIKTNALVERILASAGTITLAARRIETHAGSCPGCPQCVLASTPRPKWFGGV